MSNRLKLETKTRSFFDRELVIRRIGKTVARAMTRIGGFVRTTARRSMRKSAKSNPYSKPGEPPRYHTRKLKDLIFFSFDSKTDSLVVGPVLFSAKGPVKPTTGTVPRLLEEGGAAYSSEPTFTVLTAKAQGRDEQGRFTKKKNSSHLVEIPVGKRSYQPRPYMQPAFQKSTEASRLKRAFEVIG